jgi:hypothetical protein
VAEPFVAIQVGAVAFVDDGVQRVLDVCQEHGRINALFLATPTWTRGTSGRQLPGHPLPDHGFQEHDLEWVGGNYATVHPSTTAEPSSAPRVARLSTPNWTSSRRLSLLRGGAACR